MATEQLKRLGTRTYGLWRIVKLFREAGYKGVPGISEDVRNKTARILDALDPVTRRVSQINEPGYVEKVLADTTGAAADAAAAAIEKNSVVLGHSILDEVITEGCRLSAQLMPNNWMGFVRDRKVTLSDALENPAEDIAERLLSNYLDQLSRESLRLRMDILNERYQPAPVFEYEGRSYKFDRDRVVAIDLHRQRIIHQLQLSRGAHDNEADDLLYLEATCFFFIYIIAHKHGITLDPERDAMDDLRRSGESTPVKLAYEGLLLATVLPTADERVWSSGGQVFASDMRRHRQLPLFMPAAMPDISADHARIAFVKYRKRAGVVSVDGYVDGRNAYIGDIWTSAVDGSKMELVLEGGPHPGLIPPMAGFPEELEGITSPKFDPEARRIFFIAQAWVTSGAIYVLDLGTRETKFFTDGNGFAVLHGEPNRGSLLVSKHRYYDAPNYGSYDHLWLVSSTGQVGEDYGPDLDAALTKLYGTGGRESAFPHLR